VTIDIDFGSRVRAAMGRDSLRGLLRGSGVGGAGELAVPRLLLENHAKGRNFFRC
jgi:hypothetical protein